MKSGKFKIEFRHMGLVTAVGMGIVLIHSIYKKGKL